MKHFKQKTTLLVMITAILMQLSVAAQTSFKNVSSKSVMSVYGTSTLHDWHMNLEQLSCTADFVISNGKLQSIQGFNFSCNSKDLKSDKDKMDKLAWDALKADENPQIKASFLSMKSVNSIGGEFKATVLANVTVAGVTKQTELPVKGEVLGNGKIKIIGNKVLNMNDFNMEPPTAVMGTIKTGDQITLVYVIEFQSIN